MSNSQNQDEAFRLRLKTVAAQHSQAAIAGRTGVPLSNVNRYVRHGKVPTDFTIALVREFKLNPTWLLLGEGAPYLADVAQSSVAMGEDILALVKAMSAVAEMRLGALAGKSHGRVLRELNDALRRYETLRKKLNEHTAPLYNELISRLRDAMKKHNMELSLELRDAISQIQRLSDSPELDQRFDYANANLEYMLDNVDGALAIQRRAVRRLLAEGEIRDPLQLVQIGNLTVGLTSMGHMDEAARMADSAIRLAHPDIAGDRYLQSLKMRLAAIQFELGRTEEAMSLALRTWREMALTNPAAVNESALHYYFIFVLTGAASVESAMRVEYCGNGMEAFLIKYACWLEDPGLVARVRRFLYEGDKVLEPTSTSNSVHLLQVEKALTTRDYEPEQVMRAYGNMRRRIQAELANLIIRAQLERLCGRPEKARKLVDETELLLRQVPRDVRVRVFNMAIHARNVLDLLPKDSRSAETVETRARAVRFFHEHYRAGFGAFEAQVLATRDEYVTPQYVTPR